MNSNLLCSFLFLFLASSCNMIQGSGAEKDAAKHTAPSDSEALAPLEETYWKLIKLQGKEIEMTEHQQKETYMTLHTAEHRVAGFSGCNNFSGTYMLEEGMRIRFGQIIATRMACLDALAYEQEFLEMLSLVDNYTVHGKVLSLNAGPSAALAQFEAIALQ